MPGKGKRQSSKFELTGQVCEARFSGASLVPSDDLAQSPIVLQLKALLGSAGVEVKLAD